MDRDILIKTNIFGGFDKKQVTAYITELQSNCDGRKTRNEIEEAKRKIASLRDIIREKDKEISALTQKIDEVNAVEFQEEDGNANQYDILKRSAAKVEEAKAKADEITEKLSESVNEKNGNVNILYKKLSTVGNALDTLTGNLSKLSEEVEDVPFDVPQADENSLSGSPMDAYDKIKEEVNKRYSSENHNITAEYTEAAISVIETPEVIGIEETIVAEEAIEARETVEAEKTIETEQVIKAEETVKTEKTAENTSSEKPENATAEDNSKRRRLVPFDEDKLASLFTKLVEMTEEINLVHSSISAASDQAPEAASQPVSELSEEGNEDIAEATGHEKAEQRDDTEIIEEKDFEETELPVDEAPVPPAEEAEPDDESETVPEKTQENHGKFVYKTPIIEIIEEDPFANDTDSDDNETDVYSDSGNIPKENEEAQTEPRNISVTSIEDSHKAAEEIKPNADDTDNYYSSLLNNVKISIPEGENVIEAAVEKFKEKEKKPEPVPEKKKHTEMPKENKPTEEIEIRTEAAEQPEDKEQTAPKADSEPVKTENDNSNKNGNEIEEEIYFTLNF